MSPRPARQPFWLLLIALVTGLDLLALLQTVRTFQALPTGLLGSTWGLLLAGLFLADALAGLTLLLWVCLRPAVLEAALAALPSHSRLLGWAFLALGVLLLTGVFFALWLRIPGVYLAGLFQRLALFAWAAVALMLALKAFRPRLSWASALALAALAGLVVLQAAAVLQWVTNSPFSQGWSEGSLLYYASLVFSRRIYGEPLPLSWVYPTRALLDSLPFIIPSLPIWAHRAWGALLTLGGAALAAGLLVRRLHLRSALLRLGLAAACFLFLLQVNFKYEVLLAFILLLAGVDPRRPRRSLLFLALASFWGGMSRMNWVPVPAALAVLLLFLHKPVPPAQNWLRSLLQPVLWFLFGVGMGVLGFSFSLLLSHTPLSLMQEWGTSASYWYRLLPNPLYPPGVLLGSLLLALPLLLLAWAALRASRALPLIHRLGIAAVLVVLFAGGLLVSSKIGGGGDLHNMDAFMAAALLAGCMLAFGQPASEPRAAAASTPPAWVLALGVLLLAGFSFFHLQPHRPAAPASAASALAAMRPVITQAAAQGEVLFLSQRQLRIFGETGAVPMLHAYDLVDVAAMVNMMYYPPVDAFQEDLRAQRFSLIIADIQKDDIQDIAHHPFAEENNLWVDNIARPLLCYYQPVLELPEQGVALYAPVPQPDCRP